MTENKRAIIIVLDSVGCGSAPDAEKFDQYPANTLGHIAEAAEGFSLPNAESLGLGNICGLETLNGTENPRGAFGRMQSVSGGKDTTCGHWEIAGVTLFDPLPTYPEAFPADAVAALEKECGVQFLGNEVASGTDIIARLGREHQQSGKPILYTSADSVCQIAAHEETFGLERLYEVCRGARRALVGEHGVGRIIARPFLGEEGGFYRTANRHDFSLEPPAGHLLEKVQKAGLKTVAVGKIHDIFAGSGIAETIYTHNNAEGIEATIKAILEGENGLIWTNLVDFDMHYGHRNDTEGYAKALMDFDAALPEIINALKPGDILCVTADHGNDPTIPGTDHNREYVPLLIFGNNINPGTDLGTRPTFADLGATIAEYLGAEKLPNGTSFLADILKYRQ